MIEVLKAEKYSINIERMDESIYKLEFIFYYDKDNKKQKDIFQDSIPYFNMHTRAISLIPNTSCSCEIDEKNLIFRLKITSEFKMVADTIVGEFINYGNIGNATISQLITLAAMTGASSLDKMRNTKNTGYKNFE